MSPILLFWSQNPIEFSIFAMIVLLPIETEICIENWIG